MINVEIEEQLTKKKIFLFGTNCNKMFKKDTLEKLSKKFTMNREIMGKVDISGRKKLNCSRVETGGFNPLKKMIEFSRQNV